MRDDHDHSPPRGGDHKTCRDDVVPAHVLLAIEAHIIHANFTLSQLMRGQTDIDRRLAALEDAIVADRETTTKILQIKSLAESNIARLNTILQRSI